jgi:TM2 domain-containing membrane protein YozV
VIRKLKTKIKDRWLIWLLTLPSILMIPIVSYYFLKLISGTGIMDNIWLSNERYYLGSYVIIQTLVGFIFFKIVAFIIDLWITSWIEKNEHDLKIQLTREDEQEIRGIVTIAMWVLLLLRLISIKELDRLDEVDENSEQHEKKWKKIKEIVGAALGLLLLGITTLFVLYGAKGYLIWILAIIIILCILAAPVLIIYYLVIQNLHAINAFIRSYNRALKTSRLIAKIFR